MKRSLLAAHFLFGCCGVINDKVTQEIGGGTLKEDVMKEPLEKKHLERKVSRIEASEPSLPLLE